MNSLLVVFGLFILGLQNFNGNNGIAPISAATEFKYLQGVVDGMIDSKLQTRNVKYTKDVTTVQGLQGAIHKYFGNGIYKGIKNAAIDKLEGCVKNRQVDESDAESLKETIKNLIEKQKSDSAQPANYLSGTPPSD